MDTLFYFGDRVDSSLSLLSGCLYKPLLNEAIYRVLMIKWLKYFPVSLRDGDEPCTPQGSSFSQARPVKATIMGSKLYFRAPKHRPDSRGIRAISPGASNITFHPLSRFDSDDTDGWRYRNFFFRRWGFWGPWFCGSKAQLSMSVSLVGRTKGDGYQGVSFFYPREFENVFVNYLNSKSRNKKSVKHWERYRGPLNWQVRKLLPVIASTSDGCHLYRGRMIGVREQLMIFPISEGCFIEVVFTYFMATGGGENQQVIINAKYLNELAENIINSFSLELSPEIQIQWDAIKAQCTGMSLSETFAPLKWPVSEFQKSKEYQIEKLPVGGKKI